MFLQGLGDRASSNAMIQVLQTTLDTCVAPAWVVLRHFDDQPADLLHDPGPPDPLVRIGPLRGNQTAMPGQDRVWRDDRGNSLQYPSTEWSPLRRKSAALIVRQAHSVAAGLNLFFQDAVLFDQIVDHACLLATNPARKCGQK